MEQVLPTKVVQEQLRGDATANLTDNCLSKSGTIIREVVRAELARMGQRPVTGSCAGDAHPGW